MKRVLTAVVLIPVVLLVVFRAPLWLFALLVAAIIVLALHEYLNISEVAGYKPFHVLTYVAALFPITVALLFELYATLDGSNALRPLHFDQTIGLVAGFFTIIVLTPLALGIRLVLRKDMRQGIASTGTSLLGVFYVGVSLSCLVWLRNEASNYLIIFVLFSVWAGDIAAYYVGRSFGSHKLAPIVSPNKSWEGAIASIVASVLVAVLVFHYAWQISGLFSRSWSNMHWKFPSPGNFPFLFVPWSNVIVLGAATNIAAQFGDLFESALKRGAGIKDSGALLPGHGGILDRIDALLFAIPVVWYYALFSDILQRSTIHLTFKP